LETTARNAKSDANKLRGELDRKENLYQEMKEAFDEERKARNDAQQNSATRDDVARMENRVAEMERCLCVYGMYTCVHKCMCELMQVGRMLHAYVEDPCC
jgi:hypothetical protein